jgi:hypothetical protein
MLLSDVIPTVLSATRSINPVPARCAKCAVISGLHGASASLVDDEIFPIAVIHVVSDVYFPVARVDSLGRPVKEQKNPIVS